MRINQKNYPPIKVKDLLRILNNMSPESDVYLGKFKPNTPGDKKASRVLATTALCHVFAYPTFKEPCMVLTDDQTTTDMYPDLAAALMEHLGDDGIKPPPTAP